MSDTSHAFEQALSAMSALADEEDDLDAAVWVASLMGHALGITDRVEAEAITLAIEQTVAQVARWLAFRGNAASPVAIAAAMGARIGERVGYAHGIEALT